MLGTPDPARRRPGAARSPVSRSTPSVPTSSASSTPWYRPTRCCPSAVDLAGRIAANAPLGRGSRARSWSGSRVIDPARPRRGAPSWQPVVFGSDDAAEGATAFVEKRAPVVEGPLTCVPRSAASTARPRWCVVDELASPDCGPGPGAGPGRRGGGELPRRAAGRRSVPADGAGALRAGQRVRRRGRARWAPASVDVEVGDRVRRHGPRRRVRRGGGRRRRRRSARVPDGVDARHRRGVRRGPLDGLPRAPLGGPGPAGRGGRRARCRRRRRAGDRAARRRCSAPGDRGGVVVREARRRGRRRCHAPSSPPGRPTCAQALRSRRSRGRRRGRRPRGWRPVRAGVALPCGGAGGSSRSATRRARSRGSPSTWCCSRACRSWASSSSTSPPTRPEELAPQRGRAARAARQRAGGPPHRRPRSRSSEAAAALRLRRRRRGPSARSSSRWAPPGDRSRRRSGPVRAPAP